MPGSWQDIDLSWFLPADAPGTIIEDATVGTGGTYSGVVRGKDDRNNYMSGAAYQEIEPETHRWQIVKLDSVGRSEGFLKTVTIATDGQITNTVIDSLEFDNLAGKTPKIISISGDVYAITYTGNGDDGFLKTVLITSGGQITE